MKSSRPLFALLASVVACGTVPANPPPCVTNVLVKSERPAGPAATVTETAPPPPEEAAWSDADATVPVSSADPVWGDRDAPVTLVEFADFQCPFCAKIAPTIAQLKDDYGPRKLRVVWKNYPLPFHTNAKPAAEAAQGVFVLAGRDAFWHFYETLFANQSALSPESYERWAQDAGVTDLARFRAGLEARTFGDKVDKDMALGTSVGTRGTPASYINGVFLSGAQPIDKFKALIDEELKKAEARIAEGTDRSRIYVVMSQENKGRRGDVAANVVDDDKPDPTVFKVPATGPMLGPRTALVTIVEFSDFQCPFCAKVEPTLKALRTKYGTSLRIVWKNEPLPFHNRAEPAAQLAMEARAERGDAGFWDAHDRIFDAHAQGLADADLEGIATAMHLSLPRVRDAIAHHKFKAQIDADVELAEDLGASGTPNFFINGRHLVGAQPQDKFEKIIDEELVKAKALVAKGTPLMALYDTLTKDGKGPPEPEKKTVAAAPNAPFKGNAAAKVTIQEFSDFQCPFCARVLPTVDEVMKTYGTRVRFVWRNMPLAFHQSAPLAAEAAMEAFKQRGSAGFWAMHDKLYGNQQDLSRPTLDGYAQAMGLDMTKWTAALDGSAHQALIDADTQAANSSGINGTPAFVINGYFISGAQPFAKFKKIIDRALAEAK